MPIDTFWKNIVFVPLLLAFAPADHVSAAPQLSLTSDTIFRSLERDTSEKNNTQVLPVYEYLQLYYGDRENKGFSFHGYGWGRSDLGDDIFFDKNEDGELLYGYMEYSHSSNNLNIKLGRQHVFAGIANESVDGLRVTGDITPYFTLSAYGGLPVSLDKENGRNGDSIWGAKIAHHKGTLYNVGVSYKQIYNDDIEDEEILGIDLALTPAGPISFSGLSSRNLLSNEWAEHSYEAPFRLFEKNVRPYFHQFEYDGLFNTRSNSADPFRFLAGTDETLTIIGSDIYWWQSEKWDLAFKVKNYDYDIRTDTSRFYSSLLTWHGEELSQVGGEMGVMEGAAAENDYLLGRAFFYWDQPADNKAFDFVTGDLLYVYYNETIFGQDNSLFLSLGIGSHFFNKSLAVKLSVDYSSDPFYDNDFRGTLRIISKFPLLKEE
ncbi:MAG: hypothetical protein KKE17_10835 [Proteobacteria bacterium]|nr:hypothetical protein [Pseudomonadota bacterium]